MGGVRKIYLKKVVKKLHPLVKIKRKEILNLVPLLSDECIHSVCESCQNLLKNTFKFDEKLLKKVKRKLKFARKDIRTLANPKTSLLKKRRLLSKNQTGGGVFSILSTFIIPAILSAITQK